MDKGIAVELIESVFTFDDVGDSMMKLRKNIDDAELQAQLASDLVDAAIEDSDDKSETAKEVLMEAAKERVAQYVTSSKSTRGTGCGR